MTFQRALLELQECKDRMEQARYWIERTIKDTEGCDLHESMAYLYTAVDLLEEPNG